MRSSIDLLRCVMRLTCYKRRMRRALLDKLRIVEEKLAERDLRSREMENQVTALGEGISLD